MRIERIDAPRCLVGEGPLWDVAEQALYFIDIVGKKVHRHDPAEGSTRSWDVPEVIGSMALREQGGAIVALPDGVYSLDFASGEVAPLARPGELDSRIQFNDGKVDRRGRFIVGSTDSNLKDTQPIGSVYRLDPDHALSVLDTRIHISNGPCWSPDDRIFYFSDSLIHTIYAYDYDIESGEVANRRVFADTRELGGIPDGATVDSDGLMWMAICEGAKVVAFRPDGKVERIIDMPVALTASVMFGGPDLDLLYVTSIDPALLGRESSDDDGQTFVIEGLGARGIAEPRYAG
ncbi:MAG: SMP-30/gluconolactonase/LRE family protein [Sphingomonadaceae bacterium]|nr:SMP-30/gluconolactonase/LRE family protein [Sphingomonadaceae bacterium]